MRVCARACEGVVMVFSWYEIRDIRHRAFEGGPLVGLWHGAIFLIESGCGSVSRRCVYPGWFEEF